MSVKHLVFVKADGTTATMLVEVFPEAWIVRDNTPFQRGDIAWRLEEGEAEPHGAMVYVEVTPKHYAHERERARGDAERAAERLAVMSALVVKP